MLAEFMRVVHRALYCGQDYCSYQSLDNPDTE